MTPNKDWFESRFSEGAVLFQVEDGDVDHAAYAEDVPQLVVFRVDVNEDEEEPGLFYLEFWVDPFRSIQHTIDDVEDHAQENYWILHDSNPNRQPVVISNILSDSQRQKAKELRGGN